MREELCRAFCNEISVKEVPAGLAVGTSFRRSDGDAVSFYIVYDAVLSGLARLEDDGETIPYLEACGIDFETQTRMRAFQSLLEEHNAEFDEIEATIRTPNIRNEDIPRTLPPQLSGRSTSRAHSGKTLQREYKEKTGSRAEITEGALVSASLTEIAPDMVLRAENRDPVAIFFAQSSSPVYDAIILQMAALYESREPIIALLEAENSITREMQKRASNRLAAVTIWRGDEVASVQRIEREVVGSGNVLH